MTDSETSKHIRKPSRFGRHPKSGYHIQASVWVEKDGELYLGGGRVMLLERVEKLGSIAAAARSMGLTYSNAWLWIEAMNRLAPTPVILTTTGGTGGGSAQLTEEGHRAIEHYHKLRAGLEQLFGEGTSCLESPDGQAGHCTKRTTRKRQ